MLFPADRVHALAGWPPVDLAEIVGLCPEGVYVSRIGPGRPVDIGIPWKALVAELDLVPEELSPYTAAFLVTRLQKQGFLPWVATVGGFVAAGGDVIAVRPDRDGRPRFVLEEPGEWYDAFAGRRFETGPGRPWSIWGWQVFAQQAPPGAKHVLHRNLRTSSVPAAP